MLIYCVWGLLHRCGKRKSSLINHNHIYSVCTLGITSISHGIWEACLNILTWMKLQSREANKFIGSQFESFLLWNWTHLASRNPRHQSTSCMLLLPKGKQWFTVTRERSAVWAAFRPAVFSVQIQLWFWSISIFRKICLSRSFANPNDYSLAVIFFF